MPSKAGEEPMGKALIASRKFCSLTIKEKSPGLKASGNKSSRDGEGCFFLIECRVVACRDEYCTIGSMEFRAAIYLSFKKKTVVV
jgi:hypothetical protein